MLSLTCGPPRRAGRPSPLRTRTRAAGPGGKGSAQGRCPGGTPAGRGPCRSPPWTRRKRPPRPPPRPECRRRARTPQALARPRDRSKRRTQAGCRALVERSHPAPCMLPLRHTQPDHIQPDRIFLDHTLLDHTLPGRPLPVRRLSGHHLLSQSRPRCRSRPSSLPRQAGELLCSHPLRPGPVLLPTRRSRRRWESLKENAQRGCPNATPACRRCKSKRTFNWKSILKNSEAALFNKKSRSSASLVRG